MSPTPSVDRVPKTSREREKKKKDQGSQQTETVVKKIFYIKK